MTPADNAQAELQLESQTELTEVAYRPAGLLTFDRWVEVGENLHGMLRGLSWWRGDWWLYGEERYGEKHSQAAPEDLGALNTLKNCAAVCERIPPERRRPEKSYSHHAVVAYMPDQAAADRLLQQAIDDDLSVRALADLVRRHRESIDIEPAATDADSGEDLTGPTDDDLDEAGDALVDLVMIVPDPLAARLTGSLDEVTRRRVVTWLERMGRLLRDPIVDRDVAFAELDRLAARGRFDEASAKLSALAGQGNDEAE